MNRTPESQRRAVVRLRRLGAAGIAATVIGLPLLVAGPARAQMRQSTDLANAATSTTVSQNAPTLGGWNTSADGNAVDIIFDNATGLAGIHPFTEADFPEAESQFQSGPFGSGLATIFWPGAAGGNFGSLSTELGLPAQLQPLTTKLNDPVKASAQYPSGPATSTYPNGAPGGVATMTATAEAGGTAAEGAITDQNPSTVLSFSSAKGISSATASNTAKAQASSDVGGVSLLGGLISIGSITSTATANSDGKTGTGAAVTRVAGVSVLGQPASIGSDGLVLPSQLAGVTGLVEPLVKNALQQVVSGLGISVTEFPSTQTANGGAFDATSGGVSVKIDPPSSVAPLLEQAASTLAPFFPSQAAIIPTLPGLLQGGSLTITLGRATASANATTAYVPPNFPPVTFPITGGGASSTGGSVSGTPVTGAGSVPVVSGSTGAAPGPSLGSTGAASTPTSSNGTGGSSSPSAPPALISLSKPLATGAVVLGILATLIAAGGLWAVGRMLLPRDVDPVCPLGQDS
ncbi:MAG TPA: choice-of-anchor P family protein [Acidimicrobiales bacterium]|nr:choice-of-anchor P family protein [Acidimicrobiales bacterium]